MANIDYKELFAKMTAKKNVGNDFNKNVLKTDIGNTIVGRFVINAEDPTKTHLISSFHFWNSMQEEGKKIFVLCPRTINTKEPCPICSKSYALYKADNPMSKIISQKRSHFANFYVISDAKNPENNGTVKILKYGDTIHKKIMEAIEGEDSQVFGENIYHLDSTGCNFRIKVDSRGEWASYESSKFLPPSAIEGMTPEKMTEILSSIHDLDKAANLSTIKTYNEITDILAKHFVSDSEILTTVKSPESKSVDASKLAKKTVKIESDDTDDLDFKDTTKPSKSNSDDLDVDKMLEDLV